MRTTATFGLIAATLVSWAAGASEPAEELDAVIWGGGKTRAEAEAALARWEAVGAAQRDRLSLSEQFPAIVTSQSVRGLNPGFHVVILGYCPRTETRTVLDFLRFHHPGAYARKVHSPTSQAVCPRVTLPAPAQISHPELLAAAGLAPTAEVIATGARKSGRLFALVRAPKRGVQLVSLHRMSGKLEKHAVAPVTVGLSGEDAFSLDVEGLAISPYEATVPGRR